MATIHAYTSWNVDGSDSHEHALRGDKEMSPAENFHFIKPAIAIAVYSDCSRQAELFEFDDKADLNSLASSSSIISTVIKHKFRQVHELIISDIKPPYFSLYLDWLQQPTADVAALVKSGLLGQVEAPPGVEEADWETLVCEHLIQLCLLGGKLQDYDFTQSVVNAFLRNKIVRKDASLADGLLNEERLARTAFGLQQCGMVGLFESLELHELAGLASIA